MFKYILSRTARQNVINNIDAGMRKRYDSLTCCEKLRCLAAIGPLYEQAQKSEEAEQLSWEDCNIRMD